MSAVAPIVDRFVPRTIATDIALVISGALLTAVAAQIQVPMYPVPMTLQTFAVLLIAAALGPLRAVSSMGLYLAMGAAGLPVFAAAKSLSAVWPTAGYLFGFMVAGLVVGFLATRGFSSTPARVALSFAVGSALIYLFGAGWLVLGLGLSVPAAIAGGIAPFIVGDIVKAVAAAAFLPAAWKLVR
jgi:biotin transport system substrate-specific component